MLAKSLKLQLHHDQIHIRGTAGTVEQDNKESVEKEKVLQHHHVYFHTIRRLRNWPAKEASLAISRQS